MTKQKLQEKYGDSMKLVTKDGKSNIILLERITYILSEQWHSERKTNISEESERVIRTATKVLREAIKNNEHESDTYPAADDITLCYIFLKYF